jgi:hypothetical protein
MVKRSKNVARPAGRRPAPKPAARPAAEPSVVRSGSSLTEAEIRTAAELEAQLVAQEKAAEQVRRRVRGGRDAFTGDVNAPLAVRAAHEYAYVARDVRHIIFTAAIMTGLLAVLHVLINVLGVVSL